MFVVLALVFLFATRMSSLVCVSVVSIVMRIGIGIGMRIGFGIW